MKKTALFILLISLTGCGRFGDSYQPQLSSPPKDRAKFESDRTACISEARRRQASAKPSGFNAGVFGLSGLLIDKAVNEQEDDYHKTPMLMTDECMTSKGYKINER